MRSALARLAAELGGRLHLPGDAQYVSATAPRNSSANQKPAAVAAVRDAQEVSACVQVAARAGLRVAVQATGHGAAGTLGSEALLLDTSEMRELDIDTERRSARVGSGVRSADLNAAAERVGLLAPVGTAPGVGVIGYSIYGGVGWMTRAFGMASAALMSVQFIDGRGQLRRASPDGDLEALWAFRGGGGAGVVVSAELRLRPADQLWGGYALWPLTDAHMIARAWSSLVEHADSDFSSIISTLRTPSAPPSLRGHTAVYLGAASPSADRASPTLAQALEDLPPPATASFGVCDAAGLLLIHLDPPVAVPAIGDGRWLHSGARRRAQEIITAAHSDGEPALAEVELRHVAAPDPGLDGALVRPPGDYLLHAVGLADAAATRYSIEQELASVRAAAGPHDTGRSAAAFCDGQEHAPGALGLAERGRLAELRARLDPDRMFVSARSLC